MIEAVGYEVGSLADFATLLVALYYRRPLVATAAAVVALANARDDVDADRVQADARVSDAQVEKYQREAQERSL